MEKTFEMLLKALDMWRRNGERFEWEQFLILSSEYKWPEHIKKLESKRERIRQNIEAKYLEVRKPYDERVTKLRIQYVELADELYKEFNQPGSKGDVVIYTNPHRLELKQGKLNYNEFCWTFTDGYEPRTCPIIERLFFAVKGFVVGYFKTGYTRGEEPYHNSIAFDPDSWQDIEPVPVKVFRGFRYRWFDYSEVINE